MSSSLPILELRKLAYGVITTQAISVMAELKIADALAAGSRTPAAIAELLDLDASAVGRLLRFLSSVGVVTTESNGEFRLTAMGELLRSDVSGSFGHMAQIFGSDYGARTFSNIAHSIRTGGPAFDDAHGMGLFEYLQPREKDRKNFYSGFTELSQSQAPAIANAFDFQQFDSIVDVGGGYGYLLLEILKYYDYPTGILYDMKDVIGDARPLIEKEGLTDRCQAIEGDFFTSVPSGSGAYIMKLIIHDWSDDRAVEILTRCREAMADGGRVIVVDMVVPEGPDYGLTLAADMNMMLLAGGRERTRSEFALLCERSGLKLVSVTPTLTSLAVLEMAAV
jgi:hypothetical protein